MRMRYILYGTAGRDSTYTYMCSLRGREVCMCRRAINMYKYKPSTCCRHLVESFSPVDQVLLAHTLSVPPSPPYHHSSSTPSTLGQTCGTPHYTAVSVCVLAHLASSVCQLPRTERGDSTRYGPLLPLHPLRYRSRDIDWRCYTYTLIMVG